MARKGVTQQLICLLLISDGQGSHNVSQSGLAICKLHWQRISVPATDKFQEETRNTSLNRPILWMILISYICSNNCAELSSSAFH